MSKDLRAALREACAELRWSRQLSSTTPDAQIEAWERLANEPDSTGTSAVVRPDRTTVSPPAMEECARCGVVGPVDVACRGCPPVGILARPGSPEAEEAQAAVDAMISESRAYRAAASALDRESEPPPPAALRPGNASPPRPAIPCVRCGRRLCEHGVGPSSCKFEAFERDPRGQLDAGARAVMLPLCCRRIGDWWCLWPDGHAGPCLPHVSRGPRELPAVDFGPRAATTTRRGQP